MNTVRTRSQTNKKSSKSLRASQTPRPKLFDLISALHNRISVKTNSTENQPWQNHLITLAEYKAKLDKHKHLKQHPEFVKMLESCQLAIQDQMHNRHQFKDESISDTYGSLQLNLLRNKIESKEGMLARLYEKEKEKTQSYNNVIKQQHSQMETLKKRINQLEEQTKLPRGYGELKENLDRNNIIKLMQETVKTQRESHHQLANRLWDLENQKNTHGASTQRDISLQKQTALKQKHKQLEATVVRLQKELSKQMAKQENLQQTARQREEAYQDATEQLQRLSRVMKDKEELLEETMYEKQNYSDGYMKLKQEKQRLETVIDQVKEQLCVRGEQVQHLAGMAAQLKQQLESESQRASYLESNSDKTQDKLKDLNHRIKELLRENKELGLQLRTSQHKTEIYMQKYYRLQNSSLDQTQKRSEKSEKLVTAHTYEMSFQRPETSRKLKVLSDIKQMVRTHRSHIFDIK